MAVNVNVNISFEATSAEAAQETIDEWQLSPGCVMVATVNAIVKSGIVDDNGNVEEYSAPPLLEEDDNGSP